eukprot:sb/3470751/
MPRHDELVWQVSQLESKVEFLMENLYSRIDRIYENHSQITCNSDRNHHETELLRQEVSLLNARLYSMQPAAGNGPCSNCSKENGDNEELILEALSEAKKGMFVILSAYAQPKGQMDRVRSMANFNRTLAALSDQNKTPNPNNSNLWKKLKKTYRTPQPAEHLVDVKSIVAVRWSCCRNRPNQEKLVPDWLTTSYATEF